VTTQPHSYRPSTPSTTQSSPPCHLFFFNNPATTEIYTLSLHDALPICADAGHRDGAGWTAGDGAAQSGARLRVPGCDLAALALGARERPLAARGRPEEA